MLNYTSELARVYYALTGQTITSIPTGRTAAFWAERCYRFVAGLPDVISGGRNASFWLEQWFYVYTGQGHRRATGTLADWFWLSKLYAAYSGLNTEGILQPASETFWANKLAGVAGVLEPPEIRVEIVGTPVADGGSYNAGTVDESAVETRLVTVYNDGEDILTVDNPVAAGDIAVSAFSDTTIESGGSATFTITLDTGTDILTTARSGSFSFTNDDPDESPYSVTINFVANPVWLLRADFPTNVNPPLPSPYTAEVGSLTAVQTDGQMYIDSVLNFPAQATPVWGDQGFYGTQRNRAAGLAVVSDLVLSVAGGTGAFLFGFRNAAGVSNAGVQEGFNQLSNRWRMKEPSQLIIEDNNALVGVNYRLSVIERSSGALNFIGTKLAWVNTTQTFNPYPFIGNYDSSGAIRNFGTRQMGSPFTDDYGLVTQRLVGARAVNDTFTHEANGIIEFLVPTRTTAVSDMQIIFRRQSNTNTWALNIDLGSSGLILYEVVAGVSTSRGSAPGVIANGNRVVIIADGTTIRVYSGAPGSEILRITYSSATNFQSETGGKLTALGNGSISDIISWPRDLTTAPNTANAAAALAEINADPSSVTWLEFDGFDTEEAAPVASPRASGLTMVQVDGQFSVSGRRLQFPPQASAAWGDLGFYDPAASARTAGVALISKFKITALGSGQLIGFASTANLGLGSLGLRQQLNIDGLNYWNGSSLLNLGISQALNVDYTVAFIAKAAGVYILLKVGAGNWKPLWIETSANFANLFAVMSNFNYAGNFDYFKVRQLANAWVNANPIATQVLSGARSAGDTFVHEANCFIAWTQTAIPSVGVSRLSFRKQDSDNGWFAQINSSGTVELYERVATVNNVRGIAASVVSNGHRIAIKADGTTIRVYSGAAGSEVLRITYSSATNFQNETDGSIDFLEGSSSISNVIADPLAIPANPLAELTKGL